MKKLESMGVWRDTKLSEDRNILRGYNRLGGMDKATVEYVLGMLNGKQVDLIVNYITQNHGRSSEWNSATIQNIGDDGDEGVL